MEVLIAFCVVTGIIILIFVLDAKSEANKYRFLYGDGSSSHHSSIYDDVYPDVNVYPDVHYDIHQHITVESSPSLPMSSRYIDVEVHEPTGKIVLDGIDSTVNLFGDILSGKI